MRGIRVIGGRIERNLVGSLQFSWVLCRWSEICKLTGYGLIYCEMCGIRVIRAVVGRIERISLDSLEF